MFVNRINPIIVHWGFIEIRYYGLIYALGFVLIYLFLRHWSKEGRISLNSEQLDTLIFYLLLGVVIGARVFNIIFYQPKIIFTDPLEIFKLWHGGLSFHGGLVGAIYSIWLFAKRYQIKLMTLFDALVVPSALGLGFGRIANFTNHELVGPVANVPWCVVFPVVDNLCRHPYQLYAALSHFLLFGIVWYIYLKQKKIGTTFWSFVLGYGIMRFILDFWRVDPRLFGISMGQFLSFLMVLVAGYVFLKKKPSQSRQ